MAFPKNPIDKQEYTHSSGKIFVYEESKASWVQKSTSISKEPGIKNIISLISTLMTKQKNDLVFAEDFSNNLDINTTSTGTYRNFSYFIRMDEILLSTIQNMGSTLSDTYFYLIATNLPEVSISRDGGLTFTDVLFTKKGLYEDSNSYTTMEEQTFDTKTYGWSGCHLRQVISSTELSGFGNRIRIKLNSSSVKCTENAELSEVWIGNSGNNEYEFRGDQVQLEFAKQKSITIPLGGYIWSDWAPYDLDPSKNLIVSFGFPENPSSDEISYINKSGCNSYYKSGTDIGESNPTNFKKLTNQLYLVGEIQVMDETEGLYIYQSEKITLSNQPNGQNLQIRMIGPKDGCLIKRYLVGRL